MRTLKMIPKEIRIEENKLLQIRALMVKYDESNESQFIRELIDIGYAVKKSQLEASKGKEENWEPVYQDAAAKMIECYHLIRQSFAFNYDPNLSKYNSYQAELKSNEMHAKNHIDTLLSKGINAEKTKGEKAK